jgi:hypothetical protein
MKIVNLFLLLLVFLLSTACAKQRFSVIEKAKILSNPVLDPVDEPDDSFDVSLLCSDSRTRTIGYNLTSASSLVLSLVDDSGNSICPNSNTVQIRNSILNDRALPLITCAAATLNKYKLKLVDPTKPSNSLHWDLLNFDTQTAYISRDTKTSAWKLSSKLSKSHDTEVIYNKNTTNMDDVNCQRRASPLVIKTVDDSSKTLELTSPLKGIWFDILGANADPYAHAKKRISWITKDSYQFLVKPNSYGRVNGIDELFGDNTKGPDGKFADDGYAALAKYDLNKDNVIDAQDAIYSKLKLWSDKNFDGRAQRDELVSLADAQLVAIDLQYDTNYQEQDKYGNQTKMKSVVKYADDSYRLIFDLWFNYVGKRR